MKILLLNPPFFPRYSRSQRSPAVTKSGTLYYPVWLAYAAGTLIRAGHDVQLIDAAAHQLSREQVLNMARDFAPRLAVVDTSTPSIYNDAEVTADLKQLLPDCYTVLVGTHVSALPEESLRLAPKIDAVARGEYDATVAELAGVIERGAAPEGVSGLSLRIDGKITHTPDRPKITDLDSLPFVSEVYKHQLDVKEYFFAASDYPMVQLFTARGCPFRCFFCIYPQTMHGNTYRTRSPENVAAEFAYIVKELPEVREVVIEDDTFSVDKERVRKICELLIAQKNRLKWNANVRADLDLDTMRLMKRAGCRLIIIGFESADQTVLNNIEKGARADKMEEFFRNTKKAGLLLHAAFMAGNPGETEQTLEKTFQLARRFLPDTVQFFPLMAYPGTKAYRWAQENGFLRSSNFRDWLTEEGLHNCVLDQPHLSARRLVEWCDQSRKRYYLSFRYLWYKLGQVLLHPGELKRTVMAFYRFRKYLVRGSFERNGIRNRAEPPAEQTRA